LPDNEWRQGGFRLFFAQQRIATLHDPLRYTHALCVTPKKFNQQISSFTDPFDEMCAVFGLLRHLWV